MNLENYIVNCRKRGVDLNAFAKSVGTSYMYINHLVKGRKTPGLETLAKLLAATDGKLDLNTLRPDIFTDDEIGKQRCEALIKACRRHIKQT